MATNNPDLLYPLLEDLSQKVRFLNHRISYTIDDAEQLVNVAADQTGQAVFDTNHTAHLKDEDAHKIQYWDGEVESMRSKTASLIQRIESTESRLRGILYDCQRSLEYWRAQLHIAEVELRNAEMRYDEAVANIRKAEAAYDRARREYNSAQSAYHNCRNQTDSQGRNMNNNCSGHASRMSSAQNDMNQAQAQIQFWTEKKKQAEADIAKWKARIVVCKDSIGMLNSAILQTNHSITIVSEGLNNAQRCMEEVTAAGELVRTASARNHEQELLVEENRVHINFARKHADDSRNAFIQANILSEQVQVYGSMASEEVDRKVDLLREFSIMPNNL